VENVYAFSLLVMTDKLMIACLVKTTDTQNVKRKHWSRHHILRSVWCVQW